MFVFLRLLAGFAILFPVVADDHQCPMAKNGQPCPMHAGAKSGDPHMRDMQTIHSLFDQHKNITRSVRKIDGGIEAVTESSDPKTAAMIQEHTWAMKNRLEKGQPVRMWDPLFRELFTHAAKIAMKVTNTPKGVKVEETSTDPDVARLIQSHAEGVSEFIREGHKVMHKEHPVPTKN